MQISSSSLTLVATFGSQISVSCLEGYLWTNGIMISNITCLATKRWLFPTACEGILNFSYITAYLLRLFQFALIAMKDIYVLIEQ